MLIGHDGPHNLNLSNEKPVIRKQKYHGKSGSGISVEFKLKTGPVSMLSCSIGENGKFRLIGAVGESMPGAIPATGNTNTKCHFSVQAQNLLSVGAIALPSHHLALGIGDRTREIEIFSRMME